MFNGSLVDVFAPQLEFFWLRLLHQFNNLPTLSSTNVASKAGVILGSDSSSSNVAAVIFFLSLFEPPKI
jgi:hypothetical protein